MPAADTHGARETSLRRISVLRFVDTTFPGNALRTSELHPLISRLWLSQTLWNPETWYGDWLYNLFANCRFNRSTWLLGRLRYMKDSKVNVKFSIKYSTFNCTMIRKHSIVRLTMTRQLIRRPAYYSEGGVLLTEMPLPRIARLPSNR